MELTAALFYCWDYWTRDIVKCGNALKPNWSFSFFLMQFKISLVGSFLCWLETLITWNKIPVVFSVLSLGCRWEWRNGCLVCHSFGWWYANGLWCYRSCSMPNGTAQRDFHRCKWDCMEVTYHSVWFPMLRRIHEAWHSNQYLTIGF